MWDDALRDYIEKRTIARIPEAERVRFVRKFMGITTHHDALRYVANYPELTEAIEAIVGEPARLFQSMGLIKPPGGREKPWHQDQAYFDLPLEARICGVWIALGETKPVALPMKAGDLVISDFKIPHGTPTNTTDQQRWAVQFHYVGRSVEQTAKEYRQSLFGEAGKDVTC